MTANRSKISGSRQHGVTRGDLFILIGSTVIAVAIAGVCLTLLQRNLSHRPADLSVVHLATRLPSFYDGVFRSEDLQSTQFLLPDPITVVRGRPLLPNLNGVGPHDLLGFRNESVPRQADIIAIGDSQTYGNNALLPDSWPGQLSRTLSTSVYSMATGSWGPIQYLAMARKAVTFHPQLVIMAVYLGNDLEEAFRVAYSVEFWRSLKSAGSNLTSADLAPVKFPPDPADTVGIDLPDLGEQHFTPPLRLRSLNLTEPPIREGLTVTKRIITESYNLLRRDKVALALVVIPTKERVFVEAAGKSAIFPPSFTELVKYEDQAKQELLELKTALPELTVIDTLAALAEQTRATKGNSYPRDENGHPLPSGYSAIAHAITHNLDNLITRISPGCVTTSESGAILNFQVEGGKRYLIIDDPKVCGTTCRATPFFLMDALPLLGERSICPSKSPGD